jgi:hypothetical protein
MLLWLFQLFSSKHAPSSPPVRHPHALAIAPEANAIRTLRSVVLPTVWCAVHEYVTNIQT